MNKLTMEHIKGLIDDVEFISDPQVIICKMKVAESTIIGASYCFSKSSYDEEAGKKSAYNDAIKQLFDLEAYHQKRIRNKV